MNELFIVNMKRIGFHHWECFRSTHDLATAADYAKELVEAGHEANVQSILIGTEGTVLLGEEVEAKVCENPYCEAEATHQAPHNEHYCSECIHEHVYDEHDPDPLKKKAT